MDSLLVCVTQPLCCAQLGAFNKFTLHSHTPALQLYAAVHLAFHCIPLVPDAPAAFVPVELLCCVAGRSLN